MVPFNGGWNEGRVPHSSRLYAMGWMYSRSPEEERDHPAPGDRTYLMAAAEASLGQKEACLHDLEQLAGHRFPGLVGIIADPILAPVRSDPRFAAIVATVGLQPPR